MKQGLFVAAAAAASTAFAITALAQPVQIGAAPGDLSSGQGSAIQTEQTVRSSGPMLYASYTTLFTDNEDNAGGPGPGTSGTDSGVGMTVPGGGSLADGTVGTTSAVPGSLYQNEAGTDVQLDFTLVAPSHWNGSSYDAEASVQLGDGSWSYFTARAPYYRLLREETDGMGEQWYVCAIYASSMSGYETPDGSFAKELWLKKSDCKASSVIHLNTTNQTRINLVKSALANLGKQYVSGGNGPDGFDCSGFVNYVYKQNGLNIPRSSGEICNIREQISEEALRPGDIAGRPGHVAIYVGDGWFVHSSDTSSGVVSEFMGNYNAINPFTNYVNVVGD